MKSIYFIIIFCLLNIISTKINHLGLLLVFIEYGFILYFLTRANYLKAFLYYLIFTSVSMEMDQYIYIDGISPFIRYSFFNVPILGPFLYWFIPFVILLNCISRIRLQSNKLNYSTPLIRWLLFLALSGIISITIGLVINDNGINGSKSYPNAAITTFISYISLASIIISSLLISQDLKNKKIIISYIQKILIGIGISAIIVSLVGLTGVYGTETNNMLSPLSTAFTPFLLLFSANKDNKLRLISLIVTISIIITAFFFPNVVGSKWYIIVLVSLFFYIIYIGSIKSGWKIVSLSLLGLVILYNISEPLLILMSGNDYNNWKFSQALNTVNILKYSNFKDWFLNLDDSPAYRIDELINIFIEYTQKPLYSFFGKGFGGTTLHHTNYLVWEAGHGTFPDDEISLGAYRSMHESFAVIFLRHGLFGCIFIFSVIKELFKRINNSHLAVVGLTWFIFYWGFGKSFLIGAIALAISLTETVKSKPQHEVKLR